MNSQTLTKRAKKYLKHYKIILFVIFIIFGITGSFLELPGKYNKFLSDIPILRETWLKSSQWTGMYSSHPEGIVNMEELNLSWDSDVKISLDYSEEDHSIDGYIHSEMFCKSGRLYRTVLLTGMPNIWHPNRLDLVAFDVKHGETVTWDDTTWDDTVTWEANIRIERIGLQGTISVSSIGSERRLFEKKLRLSFDSELNEGELDVHCLSPDDWRKILEKNN